MVFELARGGVRARARDGPRRRRRAPPRSPRPAQALFLLYMSFWIFMFFVIKMWITQIVFKFWRVLSRLSADRARTLSRPLTVHNRRAVMVYY